jgi:hypothetical protein
MMVGVTVAVAIVVIVFFVAGVVFGVVWIYAMSVRRERRPKPPEDGDRGGWDPGNRDPGDPDSGHESWPNRR